MNPEELWQVDSGGQVYEASFEVLTQWVIEGAVLPTDKIRRGELRWLEAGKVPRLQSIFKNGVPGVANDERQIETTVTELPPSIEPIIHSFANEIPGNNSQDEIAHKQVFATNSEPKKPQEFQQTQRKSTLSVNENECVNHVGIEAKYVCSSCETKYCRDCPNSYGTVNVCPNCGEMCELIAKVAQQNQQRNQYQTAYSDGFGISDFFNALTFPLKHPTSFIIGSIMYAFFSIGQSAVGFGSIYLAVGALFAMMFANMLAFACLSNTIEEFTKGNLTANFMPAFEDFNIWDDVLQPAILSFGVFLVSFGLLIAVIAGGVYFAYSSIKSPQNQIIGFSEISSQNSPQVVPALNSFDELKRKDAEQKAKLAELMNPGASPQTATKPTVTIREVAPQDTEKSVAMAEKAISDMRKGQAESMLGQSPESQAAQREQLLAGLMKYGLLFFVLAAIGMLWAMFYYPAACLVAGYTKNIAAVLNPLIGLDTIKRLGFNYVKILLMQFVLGLGVAFVVVIIGVVLSPFNMPTVGNIPATFISSFVYFYYYIVFGAILGYAVYKTKNLLDN
jgi:hypothetical protein